MWNSSKNAASNNRWRRALCRHRGWAGCGRAEIDGNFIDERLVTKDDRLIGYIVKSWKVVSQNDRGFLEEFFLRKGRLPGFQCLCPSRGFKLLLHFTPGAEWSFVAGFLMGLRCSFHGSSENIHHALSFLVVFKPQRKLFLQVYVLEAFFWQIGVAYG